MIKGTDKIKDFPDHFNRLEIEVKSLAENTRGIKTATVSSFLSLRLPREKKLALIKHI